MVNGLAADSAVVPTGVLIRRSLKHCWVLVVLSASTLSACGPVQTAETPAQLQVIAEPETARVYVEDRFIAGARVLAVRPHELPPGTHHITITSPGYFPHDIEANLPSGTTTIRISLRPIPQ